MKKATINYLIILTAGILVNLFGCNKNSHYFNPKYLPESPVQINFAASDIFPKGLAYDPGNLRFFVSFASIGDIGIVTPDGLYKTFIKDKNLTATNGLKVDKDRQCLWVCNRDNGIGAYNLNSGKRISFTDLSLLLPGVPVFINDVVIDPQGNAYVTTTVSPVIYKVTTDGKASVFSKMMLLLQAQMTLGLTGSSITEKAFCW